MLARRSVLISQGHFKVQVTGDQSDFLTILSFNCFAICRLRALDGEAFLFLNLFSCKCFAFGNVHIYTMINMVIFTVNTRPLPFSHVSCIFLNHMTDKNDYKEGLKNMMPILSNLLLIFFRKNRAQT